MKLIVQPVRIARRAARMQAFMKVTLTAKLTTKKKADCLTALAQSCHLSEAAQAIGVSRQCAYEWREQDAEFAAPRHDCRDSPSS